MKRTLLVVLGLCVTTMAGVSTAVWLGRRSATPMAPSSSVTAGEGDASVANSPAQMPGDAVRISIADFLPLHGERQVLVIDVRGEGSYRDGHIPGAVNIGTEAVKERVAEILALAAGRPIVTYCSCVNEHTSAVAAVRLVEAGAPDVRALVGGYPAWVAQGGPVAKGNGSGE